MSTLDTQSSNLSAWSIVNCAASGTNVITLTPSLSGYTGPAYANFVAYSFAAANTSSGSVTLKVGALAALNVYKSDGTTQIGSGDIVSGQCYRVFYNAALNSAAGGWYLENIGMVPASLTGVTQSPAGGRLSLVTATPVMTTTQSAKTSIFYCLYNSNLVPYWTGAAWATDTFAELSLALDSNAGHTGYQQSGKNFDIFYDHNAGSGRIVSGPAWTSDVARADALVRLNGVLVNNASIVVKFDASASTATIAANLLTYLGTMRASADGQCSYVFGALAANGTAGSFLLWNMYNRVSVASVTQDSTDSWTLAAGTIRGANNSATMRCSFVSGLTEDAFLARYYCGMGAGTANGLGVGIGYDSTTAFSGAWAWSNTAATFVMGSGEFATTAIGFHYLQALEQSYSAGTATFFGDNGIAANTVGSMQNGLVVNLRM